MMAKGKEIGDPLDNVARTGKIGGRPQPSKSPNFQPSETLNTQSVESPNIQQSDTSDIQRVEVSGIQPAKTSDIQTSEMVKGQNVNSLAVQEEKKHKGRTQKTIYLPPRLARRLDRRALDEDRERSEIVADALELYLKSVPLVQNFEDEDNF
jgi:hypothetical protein